MTDEKLGTVVSACTHAESLISSNVNGQREYERKYCIRCDTLFIQRTKQDKLEEVDFYPTVA